MKLRLVSYNTHGLPWSNQNPREISNWCLQQNPDVVCLQEVFTESARTIYTDLFIGYTVIKPRDEGITFFSSGLLTLIQNTTLNLVTERFEPFLVHDSVETCVNKGFQCIILQHRVTGRMITLMNTHTQSTTVATIFTSHERIQRILRDQMEQIVSTVRKDLPAFIIGDFNCEASPHCDVRFFYPAAPLRKSTFPETGEDLDHIAWLPLQWTLPGQPWCNMDTTGPRIVSYNVTPLPYSDHYPILVDLYVPAFPVQKARKCLR